MYLLQFYPRELELSITFRQLVVSFAAVLHDVTQHSPESVSLREALRDIAKDVCEGDQLTRSNFHFPSGHSLHIFTLDDSNNVVTT